MFFPVILFLGVVSTLIIIYIVKRIQIAKALKKIEEMVETHEEKMFIEELKQIKNRNFLEKADNGKDERV